MKLGKLGVWYFTDLMSASQAAEAAQRIEALGYSALWLPETVGRNPFARAAWLLRKHNP
jgi:alkanesulfonate monooxygenase SsuD/methylene tetrahydromethanopterin reductase-like flavin-dependent oxidoreductase (luciferase family)